ncbi:hypothetical protein DCAR_0310789 [Daucus carota subsp. sativus]|uniref:Uncharacterized protein n=1 Tax=Daucus carota subsp. sativus TaxID=79200 RepID=A0A162AH28_DAUCS|nr:hypothetical protein DCAR_0310789 [Daucus carota subsp. sativus]
MMDKYGLKRPPLSPLSPSSIQRGQRRRIPANESSDGYGSRVCKENQHPNLTAQKSTPGGTTQDFCTPSQRRLRDVDLSGIRNDASRTISLIHNHSIDSTSKGKAHNGVDSRSQSGKDDDVTVIVPEPGQLGVKTPEWFQSDSQRGVRNLMESFNSACTTEAGTSATRGAPPMTGNNSSQTEEGSVLIDLPPQSSIRSFHISIG